MTPTAEYTRRRRKVISHADEHPWPPPMRSTPEHLRAARLHCAQRVLDGKLPRAELHNLLGMLGLLP